MPRLAATGLLPLASLRAATGAARAPAGPRQDTALDHEAVASRLVHSHAARPARLAPRAQEAPVPRRHRDRAGRGRRCRKIHLRPGARPLAREGARRDHGAPGTPAPVALHARRRRLVEGAAAHLRRAGRRRRHAVSGLRALSAGRLHGPRPLPALPQGAPLRARRWSRAVRAVPRSPELRARGAAPRSVRAAAVAQCAGPPDARGGAPLLPAHPRSRHPDRAASRSRARRAAQDHGARRLRAPPQPGGPRRRLVRQRRALRGGLPAAGRGRRGPQSPHLGGAVGRIMNPHPNGRRPLVAELVGPAGTGKSAVSQCLARRPGVMRASVWNLPRGWWLLNAVRSLPTLLALCARTRPLPWEELRQLVRLRTLRQVLERRPVQHVPLVVLDEGPVFALAWLRLFGRQRRRGDALAPWWQRALQQWAAALDIVVRVNAPDAVLLERIRPRGEPHRVKHRPHAEIRAVLPA